MSTHHGFQILGLRHFVVAFCIPKALDSVGFSITTNGPRERSVEFWDITRSARCGALVAPMPRCFLSFGVLRTVQAKDFTPGIATTCACKAHIGIGWSVSESVPKRDPKPVIR